MESQFGLINMWTQGDIVTRAVALLLLGMSFASWMVIIIKALDLRRAMSQSKSTEAFRHSADSSPRPSGNKSSPPARDRIPAWASGPVTLLGVIGSFVFITHTLAFIFCRPGKGCLDEGELGGGVVHSQSEVEKVLSQVRRVCLLGSGLEFHELFRCQHRRQVEGDSGSAHRLVWGGFIGGGHCVTCVMHKQIMRHAESRKEKVCVTHKIILLLFRD